MVGFLARYLLCPMMYLPILWLLQGSVAQAADGTDGSFMMKTDTFDGPANIPNVTRGCVLGVEYFIPDWPKRARQAGLTTLALHAPPSQIIEFLTTPAGEEFTSGCAAHGIHLEFEMHAISELLPRELFAKAPYLFRVDETGSRTQHGNLCPSSREALEIVCANAVRLARQLRPTTHRYFLWSDDGPGWCHCEQCRELSDSDQALLVENAIIKALRAEVDPDAQLAHLAYHNTLRPPQKIAPEAGIFLEFAPFHRRMDCPLTADDPIQREQVEALRANIDFFGSKHAQVLEYWLDVSKFSKHNRPPVALPWREDVLEADLELYVSLGIRHVTSFAVYIDTEYLALHGEPPLAVYGQYLREYLSE